MSWLGNIFGVGQAVDGVSAIGNVIDGLFTSDEERAQGAFVIEKLRQQPHLLQAELNKIEAAHRSIFVAGWRPFIGWVCGIGLAWSFLGHPIFEWVVTLQGLDIVPPDIHSDNMMELIISMLGLGGLRTFEKLKGKAK